MLKEDVKKSIPEGFMSSNPFENFEIAVFPNRWPSFNPFAENIFANTENKLVNK